MATTTSVAVPVSVAPSAIWTLIYTAAGTVNLVIQNRSNSEEMLVRVGSATAADDSADAAAEFLYPRESRTFALVSGDKVHARPLSSGPTTAILRV